MTWVSAFIQARVTAYLASPEFTEEMRGKIEAACIDIIRKGRDTDLTPHGFLLKMAVELFDSAAGNMSWLAAKSHAANIYTDFRRDCDVKFGDPSFDWSGACAREIAHEYSIQYWESQRK